MKNMKQGLLLSIILLSTSVIVEAKENQPKGASLNNAQITSLLVGKTMTGKGWSDTLNKDGTYDTIYKGKASKGKYLIKNGLLCTGPKSVRCRSITKTGNGYFAKSVSGGGSSYNFKVK